MTLQTRRAPSRAENGSALAEMAIIAPLLVLLLIGLMEVGRFGNYTILVGNAARAGVQYGAQNLITADDTAGMQTSATNDGQNITGLSAVASHYCECADGSASQCLATDCPNSHRLVFVKVVATGTMPSLTNFAALPASLRTITVSNTAIMRVAQ